MISNLKNQFMLDPNIIFLNHGSFGACAKPVYENLLEWQVKMELDPVNFFEDILFDALKASRQALGDYVGCSSDNLVYFPNPTTAVNAVARSLKLKSEEQKLTQAQQVRKEEEQRLKDKEQQLKDEEQRLKEKEQNKRLGLAYLLAETI